MNRGSEYFDDFEITTSKGSCMFLSFASAWLCVEQLAFIGLKKQTQTALGTGRKCESWNQARGNTQDLSRLSN